MIEIKRIFTIVGKYDRTSCHLTWILDLIAAPVGPHTRTEVTWEQEILSCGRRDLELSKRTSSEMRVQLEFLVLFLVFLGESVSQVILVDPPGRASIGQYKPQCNLATVSLSASMFNNLNNLDFDLENMTKYIQN